MSLADRYRRWFEYEKAAHAKLLHSLQSMPVELLGAPEYIKAVELAGHIVAAREMWLFRLGEGKAPPAHLFEQGLGVPELQARFQRIHAEWSNYLGNLTDSGLARVFEYRRGEMEYASTVEDVLTQLHGHSLYHLGQVASLIRRMGIEPPGFDFILWTREVGSRVAGLNVP